jgi:hypothetical protein
MSDRSEDLMPVRGSVGAVANLGRRHSCIDRRRPDPALYSNRPWDRGVSTSPMSAASLLLTFEPGPKRSARCKRVRVISSGRSLAGIPSGKALGERSSPP